MTSLRPFDMPSSPVLKQRQMGGVKKIERACCLTLTYLPLVFVYGLTTWAVWVEASIGFEERRPRWTGIPTSLLGAVLYLLLAWSYTVAVFVDPGSPISSKGGYSHLPTQESQYSAPLTVKSTGGTRYCKKCQARKPDRAHHCSTCQRCVLKMDHHCPWLATCLGLHNYKAFVLFLIYTTLFCLVCFAVSMGWIYSEILSDGQYSENLMPVNYLILAVVSGIFALALGGFTGWHISLACRNQTTIEKLEKTRYLSTWRNSMHQQHQQQQHRHVNGHAAPSYREQLREIHANALPGITRPEEGEVEEEAEAEQDRQFSTGADNRRPSARDSLTASYAELERSRERERYERYLDEQDSERLPHAFDLGWRRNLRHVFGDRALLWFVPICNSIGDGWHWEASPRWRQARDEMTRRRAEQHLRERDAGWGAVAHPSFNHGNADDDNDDDENGGDGGIGPGGITLQYGSQPSPYDRIHHPDDDRPPP